VKMRGCVISRAVWAIHRVLSEHDGEIQTGPLQLPQQTVPQFVGKRATWFAGDPGQAEQKARDPGATGLFRKETLLRIVAPAENMRVRVQIGRASCRERV